MQFPSRPTRFGSTYIGILAYSERRNPILDLLSDHAKILERQSELRKFGTFHENLKGIQHEGFEIFCILRIIFPYEYTCMLLLFYSQGSFNLTSSKFGPGGCYSSSRVLRARPTQRVCYTSGRHCCLPAAAVPA